MAVDRVASGQSRWTTRGTLGSVGIAVATMLVAGCGSSGTPAPAGSAGPATSTAASATATATPSAATTSPQPDPSDPVAQKLCDQIKPQLSDWRVQGPTLGGAALNITVHQWALGNGGLAMSARVLADKAMIDRITIKTCPDVRTDALQALNLQNFASGILF